MGNVSGRGGRRRRRAERLTVEGPRSAPAAQVCFTGAPIEYGNEDNLTDIEKKQRLSRAHLPALDQAPGHQATVHLQ